MGSSSAFLASSILKSVILSDGAGLSPREGPVRSAGRSAPPPMDDFLGLATGSFFRGSPEALSSSGPSTAAGEITLMGVVYGPRSIARALILETGQQRPGSYAIGQEVAGFQVAAIHPRAITVDQGGTRYRIDVGEKSGNAINESAPPAAASQPAASSGSGEVHRVTVERAQVLRLVQNPQEFGQAALYSQGGQVYGIRLVLVPPQSVAFQIGARSMDIVRRINGEQLNDMQKMLQLVQQLGNANELTIDLERGGRLHTYIVTIR